MVCKTKTERAALLSSMGGVSFTRKELSAMPVKESVSMDLDDIGVDFEIDELDENGEMFEEDQAAAINQEWEAFAEDVKEKVPMQDKSFYVNGSEYYFSNDEDVYRIIDRLLYRGNEVSEASQIDVKQFENGIIKISVRSFNKGWNQEFLLHPLKYDEDTCNDISNALLDFERRRVNYLESTDSSDKSWQRECMVAEATAALNLLGHEIQEKDIEKLTPSQIKTKVIGAVLEQAHDLQFYKNWNYAFNKLGIK